MKCRFVRYSLPGRPDVLLLSDVHYSEKQFHREQLAEGALAGVLIHEGVRTPSPLHAMSLRMFRRLRGHPLPKRASGHTKRKKLPRNRDRHERVHKICDQGHTCKIVYVHADLTKDEFRAGMRQIPFATRCWTAFGLLGLLCWGLLHIILDVALKRDGLKIFDANCTCEDTFRTFDAWLPLILTQRDARLIEILDREIERNEYETLPVLYGAAHMIAVAKYLEGRGYTQSESRLVLAEYANKAILPRHTGYEKATSAMKEQFCRPQTAAGRRNDVEIIGSGKVNIQPSSEGWDKALTSPSTKGFSIQAPNFVTGPVSVSE